MNFDERMMQRLTNAEREIERLKVKESAGAWMDWTPTETGWAAGFTAVARYSIVGKIVHFAVYITGTSNSTTSQVSLPFTSANSGVGFGGACFYAVNNNSVIAAAARWDITPNTSVINFYSTFSGGTWTASSVKTIAASGFYEAA